MSKWAKRLLASKHIKIYFFKLQNPKRERGQFLSFWLDVCRQFCKHKQSLSLFVTPQISTLVTSPARSRKPKRESEIEWRRRERARVCVTDEEEENVLFVFIENNKMNNAGKRSGKRGRNVSETHTQITKRKTYLKKGRAKRKKGKNRIHLKKTLTRNQNAVRN